MASKASPSAGSHVRRGKKAPGRVKSAEPVKAGGGRESQGASGKSGVAIVGSLNMDLVVRTEMIPAPGQTVLGQDLMENSGGKGANQAAAVGRLVRGGGARMIGKIGDDAYGRRILGDLQAAGVECSAVLTDRHAATGAAMIVVDRHGENAIVVAAGANRELSATDILAQRKSIEASAVLLVQLEVPGDTVACAVALAKRCGVMTVLDPAPVSAEGLPESLYHVDILTPNQTEAEMLSGIAVRTPDDARRAAERFLARGTRMVIVKLAAQGAVIVQRDGGGRPVAEHVPGFRVPVTDTTAAGDAFAGALCVGLAEGMNLKEAVRFANAAGALACTKQGAMAAMPARAEVMNLLRITPAVAVHG